MGFGSPQFLLLLIPLGFVLWRKYFRPPEPPPAVPFPEAGFESLEPDASTRLLDRLPAVLIAVGSVLLILALARPQRLRLLPPVGQQGDAIMLVIDVSDSMHALDFNPKDRITAAKDAARDFIRHRVTDRIGITIFASMALLQCPLTTDYAALLDYLDLVDIGIVNPNSTAIGDGLTVAINHLKDAPGENKTIVLLTDGVNNAGDVDPLTAAQVAKTFGIKIYAIGAGAKGPALIPVEDAMGRHLVRINDELDEGALIALARTTGGEYFRATNVKELYNIYAEIDRLEKPAVPVPPRIQRIDLYTWFLLPALLLLAGEALLSQTVLLTLP